MSVGDLAREELVMDSWEQSLDIYQIDALAYPRTCKYHQSL